MKFFDPLVECSWPSALSVTMLIHSQKGQWTISQDIVVSKPQQQVKCAACLISSSVMSKQIACQSGYSFIIVGISCTQFPVTKFPQKAVCDEAEALSCSKWSIVYSNTGFNTSHARHQSQPVKEEKGILFNIRYLMHYWWIIIHR
jgi:hypothetical protein